MNEFALLVVLIAFLMGMTWFIVDIVSFTRQIRIDRHNALLTYFRGITATYRKFNQNNFQFRVQIDRCTYEFEADNVPEAVRHSTEAVEGLKKKSFKLYVHKFNKWFEVTP